MRFRVSRKFPGWKRLFVVASVTALLVLAVHFLLLDYIFSNAVDRAASIGFSPSDDPIAAIPEIQNEGHTCGLHALRSLYKSYRLNPDEHNLRFRLGVDRAAVPVDDSTQGTLQPDLCRVLAQDGFLVRSLDVIAEGAEAELENHMNRGQKAIVLIRKKSNGGLHWILLQQGEEIGVEAIDSEHVSPYLRATALFLQEEAINVFLVEARAAHQRSEIKEAHRLGTRLMKKTFERVEVLEARNPKISSS